MATQTKGFCKYCGKEYAKSGMVRHLSSCKARKAKLEKAAEKTKCGYFQVIISDKYNKDYWLIVEINENATLIDLDQFIRDIWVECCGHLSAFEIDGVSYESMPGDFFWGEPPEDMHHQLKKIFKVGQTIGYEYDFGSTTKLVLKVQDYYIVGRKKEKITLLSRNNPIKILCSQCGKNEATWVDSQRLYEEAPFWCEECMRERAKEGIDPEELDDWDEDLVNGDEFYEMLLPVCNSPRMGICGYEGSEEYSNQFVPDEG